LLDADRSLAGRRVARQAVVPLKHATEDIGCERNGVLWIAVGIAAGIDLLRRTDPGAELIEAARAGHEQDRADHWNATLTEITASPTSGASSVRTEASTPAAQRPAGDPSADRCSGRRLSPIENRTSIVFGSPVSVQL